MPTLMIRWLSLAIVLAALASCAGGTPPVKKAGERKNHHGCDYCHGSSNPTSSSDLTVQKEEAGTLCLMCHDYGTNHHPSGFPPSKSQYVDPEKAFPLYEGKFECLTCHDPHAGADFTETPMLLRGGPYKDRWDICFKCHVKEQYAKINPHQMLDEQRGIRMIDEKPVCLLCHAVEPNPKTDRSEDIRLRADVGFLCWRCHSSMTGEFFDHHFLRRFSKSTAKNLRNAEKKHDVILPLDGRKRLTCSTCHNPHQKGVIVNSAARKGAGDPLRLRLQKQDLCLACHPAK
jgi:predicted CXXCH cytochrome family protein